LCAGARILIPKSRKTEIEQALKAGVEWMKVGPATENGSLNRNILILHAGKTPPKPFYELHRFNN